MGAWRGMRGSLLNQEEITQSPEDHRREFPTVCLENCLEELLLGFERRVTVITDTG